MPINLQSDQLPKHTQNNANNQSNLENNQIKSQHEEIGDSAWRESQSKF